MRKDIFIHFSFWFAFFVAIAVFRVYFTITYLPFWLGGLLGLVLPDIDHFIYIYFVKHSDLSSQRVNYLMNKKSIFRSVQLLYETRDERKELIFHSIFFQAIFFALTFWIVSSSGSIFGRGLALSFIFHLSIDQLIDFNEVGNLNNWYTNLPFKFDYPQSKTFWMISVGLILLMGIVM
ncbi:MAG: hypothetical protein GYA62_10180 [Bacteroidales bacterium]|nr:hypothetical protein [Bacteroidales bacterium]